MATTNKRVPGKRANSTKKTAGERLVYGEYPVGEGLVFIPGERATFLAQMWSAMVASKTWGDLKRLAPPDVFRHIQDEVVNRKDVDPDELEPNAPFNYSTMTGVSDGDYPGWPAREMCQWMPKDIQREFGTLGSSMLNGEFLESDPKDAAAIVQRLTMAGFRCRDQSLIEEAHGE